MTETEIFVSGSPFKMEFNPNKKKFKIFAADENTVATSKDGTKTKLYHVDSHRKALETWPGKPLIANHGKMGTKQFGKVLSAEVNPKGLVLEVEVTDSRMVQYLENKMYEGFSIGTIVKTDDIVGDHIMSYNSAELSVIMYPEEPACPKGVCDIISMMSSCNHQDKNNEVATMSEETINSPGPCKCGGKGEEEMVSSAQYVVMLSAKDEKIKELTTKIQTVETQLNEKVEMLKTRDAKLKEFEAKEKIAFASSKGLPMDKGIDYANMEMAYIETLVTIHENAKAAAESEAPAEVATPSVEEQKLKQANKPWLPSKPLKVGEYS